MLEDINNHTNIGAIFRCAAALGMTVTGEYAGGSADSGFTAQVGAPTVCAVGPVGGKAHSPEEFCRLDSLVPRAKALALVHAETSTGVAQPLDEIAETVSEHPALFVLDTVTSLAGMPVEVDRWGVDVCYSGTQKCLSVPPGLAPITFSERAVEAVRKRSRPVQSWYLDLTSIMSYWGGDRAYHHTAPITMVYALREGLRLVLEEGLEARWARHVRNHVALKAGLEALGLKYTAAPACQMPQLNAVRIPDGVDDLACRKRLLTEFGIEIGGGLGDFKGKASPVLYVAGMAAAWLYRPWLGLAFFVGVAVLNQDVFYPPRIQCRAAPAGKHQPDSCDSKPCR